jgi:hypothetical protein
MSRQTRKIVNGKMETSLGSEVEQPNDQVEPHQTNSTLLTTVDSAVNLY